MIRIRTANPVHDAEVAAIDWRPVVGYCTECGIDIHGRDSVYEEDDGYLFETGEFVCADCLRAYCNRHFRI